MNTDVTQYILTALNRWSADDNNQIPVDKIFPWHQIGLSSRHQSCDVTLPGLQFNGVKK